MRFRFFALLAVGLSMAMASAETPMSVPEIIQRAQRGETEAYLTMAVGHRYGCLGFDQSLYDATMCYCLANVDTDSIAQEAYNRDPVDELGCMYRLLVSLNSDGIDATIANFKDVQFPDKAWARIYQNLAANYGREDMCDYALSLVDENSTGDEFYIVFRFLHVLLNNDDMPDIDPTPKMKLWVEKSPYLYNLAGEKYFDEYEKSPSEDEEYINMAIACFKRANRHGMLEPGNAVRILQVNEENPELIRMYFNGEDLGRLRQLAEKE